MKTKLTEICLGGYETPETRTLEIASEGLLCQSGELTIIDWERDGSLDF